MVLVIDLDPAVAAEPDVDLVVAEVVADPAAAVDVLPHPLNFTLTAAISSRYGVLQILQPLKPTSLQPRSSHITRITFGFASPAARAVPGRNGPTTKTADRQFRQKRASDKGLGPCSEGC